MRKIIFFIITMIILFACSTVPITGRRTINLIPSNQINSMSFQQYDSFLKSNNVSSPKKQSYLVKKVGRKIQKAVEEYFKQKGISDKLNGYEWEFNLVESDEVNAWCMPGGKVVVYTGILSITKDETGLAVVMGYEIAHAIAGHSNERMSQGMIAQFGGMALAKALEEKPAKTQQLWMTTSGVGSQFGVMLPFSRMHESEADHLGLIFMAMAGYNPAKAVDFWQRMADMKGGQAPPEFLSTHPADATRIRDLKALLPESLTYYKK
ncbi:MAG: M48 family metallopeptidase [Candidatus Cloacimonetes bacterium]|nr:M48 family metallopeptidase [Candidatus Cloacimonadota bacterium]